MTKLYSKPGCVQCNATKRFLDNKGVEYEYIDVTQDSDAYDHVVGLGYQQVPVVETESDHWSGFNPGKLVTL